MEWRWEKYTKGLPQESSPGTQDVAVGVAANAAVQAWGISVGPVAIGVLARAIAVDRAGNTMTIYQTDQGPVTISQNGRVTAIQRPVETEGPGLPPSLRVRK